MKLFRGISVPRTKIFRTEIPVTDHLARGTKYFVTGQRCRFTQWLVHDLRLRTLQTAGQVNPYSPESSGFFIATLLTLRNGTWSYTSTCSTA